MTTLHANSPRDALTRLEMMIMLTGMELPLRAMRQQIAAALNMVVQIDRLQGGPRRITSISEVVGMEGEVVTLQELFVFRQLGIDHKGQAHGQFETTGMRPHFEARMKATGIELPHELFKARVLLPA